MLSRGCMSQSCTRTSRLLLDPTLGQVENIAAHRGHVIGRERECFLRLLFVPVVGCIKEIDDRSEVGEACTWGFSTNFSVMNMETNELLASLVMHYN